MTFILVLTILVSISSHTLFMQWRDDVFRGGNGLVQKGHEGWVSRVAAHFWTRDKARRAI